MPENRSLALVTGGAHRLGREIAFTLAREGYAIGLHYHASHTEAGQTIHDLREENVEVYPLPADLTDPDQIKMMFGEVDQIPHPLRVLVNSAAVMPHSNLLEIGIEEWDSTMALNLRAPLLCAQAAALRMADHGGVIINLSDAGAQKTWTGYPAYTVSKAGLETLTRLLARALAPNIRVNAIAPGLILPSQQTSAEDWQRLVQRLPMKHAGSPQDIARAVVFLLQNEYITGQTLVIDGGYQIL